MVQLPPTGLKFGPKPFWLAVSPPKTNIISLDTHEILHETFWNQPLAKRESVKIPCQTCELQFPTRTNNTAFKKKMHKQRKKTNSIKCMVLIKFDHFFCFVCFVVPNQNKT